MTELLLLNENACNEHRGQRCEGYVDGEIDGRLVASYLGENGVQRFANKLLRDMVF